MSPTVMHTGSSVQDLSVVLRSLAFSCFRNNNYADVITMYMYAEIDGYWNLKDEPYIFWLTLHVVVSGI
jgi:hypothetical protein